MKRNISRIFLVISILTANSANASKILAIFPIPMQEHQIVYRPLIENLLKNGHEITLMTTDPFFNSERLVEYQNVTEIDLSFVYSLEVLKKLNDGDLDGSEMLKTVFEVMRDISEAELMSPHVKDLLDNTEYNHFDAVLVEWSGSASLLNIFAYKYDIPLIAITNGDAFPNIHEAIGNPNHPILYPSTFLPFGDNLNIVQRISSVLFTIWYRFYYYNEEIPLQNELIRKILNSDDVPDMWEIESNADLLLVNSYEALGNVRPSVPTTIYLGGIHQKTELNQLPASLKEFLDGSEKVIYVNLNQGVHYYKSRLEKLTAALETAGYDIVWNWSNGNLINTTARIYQSPVLEQEEVLAHPKVVMHISDGGQRNIEDSIHHAVPVLGISYSVSTEHYLRQVQKFECGLISYIDFDNQMEIIQKIEDLATSFKYKSNMKKLKRLILDQPISSSVERATWWIQFVIRNEGTKHFNNEYKTIKWYKFVMIDVAVAVMVAFLAMVCAFAYTIQKIRKYSKSLPFEKVTRGSKCKVL